MKSILPLLPLAALLTLGLAACGKSETSAPAEAPAAADGVRNVNLTANDQMQFSLKEIQAAPGEKLRLVFSNVGRMPKQSMGHNWVLLKPMTDSEINALAMGAASRKPDYMPEDMGAVLAHTKLLGGGEMDMINFTAPSVPGEYPYLCTFPGHFAVMRGKLVVR